MSNFEIRNCDLLLEKLELEIETLAGLKSAEILSFIKKLEKVDDTLLNELARLEGLEQALAKEEEKFNSL